MSPLKYEPLPDDGKTIRLLRIQVSGDWKYTLLHADVSLGRYLALSYPWGEHRNRKAIQVDGDSCSVTPNLARALDDVVAYWKSTYPDRADLLLWTDQVCINQQDLEEKSHQVSLMSTIYRKASQVLVWLPLGRDVRFGFKDWSSWSKWHREQITSPQSNSLPPGRVAMSYEAISQPRQDFPVASEGDAVVKDQLIAWENVHSIIASPWWERGWAFQEFMLPRKATFLFGGLRAPWEELNSLISLYSGRRESHEKFCTLTINMMKHQEGQVTSMPKCCGCFGGEEASQPAKDPDVAKDQRQYLRRHNQRLIEMSDSWNTVNYMFSAKADRFEVKDQEKGSLPYTPLFDLLKHARNCKVSEPRDKVYAFLGLVDPELEPEIDYSLPARDVLIDAARAVIQEEQRLDILGIARQNKPGGTLPSWVPDWSTKEGFNTPYNEFLRQIRFPVARYSYGGGGPRASKSSSPVVSFLPDDNGNPHGILQARALLVDRLSRVIENDEAKPCRRFEADSGREIDTVKEAEVGDEVWVILGADEVFTLRAEETSYVILGHAMVLEQDGTTSDILYGSMMNDLRKGVASAMDIKIG